jgi:hypothetical protein
MFYSFPPLDFWQKSTPDGPSNPNFRGMQLVIFGSHRLLDERTVTWGGTGGRRTIFRCTSPLPVFGRF